MKHFFFIFALVFFAFPVLAKEMVQPANQPQPVETVQDSNDTPPQWMINLAYRLSEWQQAAKKTKPQEAAKWDKYNLFTPAFLMGTDASPLSGLQGYGEWQNFSFGRIRLISCHSGLKITPPVFTAVQVQTNRDWFMRKPAIRLNAPVQEAVISYPLIYPLPNGVTKTDFYAGQISFPIMMIPKSFDTDLHLSVTVDFKAYNTFNGDSETDTANLVLTLTPQSGHNTGICPWMINELQWAPRPLKDEFTVSATLDKSGDVQLYYHLNKDTKILSVQIDEDWTFTEQQKMINYPAASIIIRPSQKLKAGDTIALKTITSFGFFDTPVQVQIGSFQNPTGLFPWKSAVFGGFMMLLFTPLFAYFMLQSAPFKKNLVKTANDTLFVIFSVGILTALAWQARLFIPTDLIQVCPLTAILFVGLVAYLIYRPKLPLTLIAILFWFLPKPYLDDAVSAAAMHPYAPIILGLWWTVTLAYPFWLIRRYPEGMFKFYNQLKKESRAILRMVRLPLWLLLAWIIIGAGVNTWINRSVPLYTPEAVKTAVADGKIVFVSAEPPVCLTCVWNKAVALKTGFARPLLKSDKLIILRVPQTSKYARTLKAAQNKPSLPVNILYGPANPYGLLVPDYLDYGDLGEYLSAVLNQK